MAALERDNADIVEDLLIHDRTLGQHTRYEHTNGIDPRATPIEYAGPRATLSLLTYGFHGSLLLGVRRALAASHEMAAIARSHSRGVDEVREYQLGSSRAQLMASGLLELRGAWSLLGIHNEGLEVLKCAVDTESKLFISHRQIQERMRRVWRGEYVDYVHWYQLHSRNTASKFRKCLRMYVVLLAAVPLNLLLMPVVSALPPLDAYLSTLGAQPLQTPHTTAYADRLRWGDLYLLKVPMFKFYVVATTDLLFALFLTFGMKLGSSSPLIAAALVVWAWVRLGHITLHIAHHARSYFTDPLHYLDVFSTVLTVLACSFNLEEIVVLALASIGAGNGATAASNVTVDAAVNARSEHYRAALFGAALPFTWMYACLVPLTLLQSIAPLVMMLERMVVDVARWLTLLIALCTGFAAGLLALYSGDGDKVDCALYDGTGTSTIMDNVYGYAVDLLAIVDLSIGTSSIDAEECLLQSNQAAAAMGLWDTLSVVVTVLMLNTLIALMTKTFDQVYETLLLSTQYLFAQRVLAATTQPTSPPPLSLLSTPWHLMRLLWKHARVPAVFPTGFSRLVNNAPAASSPHGTMPAASVSNAPDDHDASAFNDMCAGPNADFPEQLERYVEHFLHQAPDEDTRFKTLTKERLLRIEQQQRNLEDLLVAVHQHLLEPGTVGSDDSVASRVDLSTHSSAGESHPSSAGGSAMQSAVRVAAPSFKSAPSFKRGLPGGKSGKHLLRQGSRRVQWTYNHDDSDDEVANSPLFYTAAAAAELDEFEA